ncbi:MAG: TonB-dependent receptor [Bacteroidetes bacterium]|nr:TonB-dependent receptor [Bacteroidota bacterium]
MKKIIWWGLVFLTQTVWGQRLQIKGQLTDSTHTLPGATVLLLTQKDSSLVQFAASNAQGFFQLKNIPKGDFLFKITYVGYATYTKKISIHPETSTEIDLGKIKLIPQSKLLSEVVVKSEKDPVTIKRDTIEFNASSFKTKANANVEDLLKKMPSIEVGNDGTITAQGEQVQQVLVDGKEFFGQDPTLATRNLPANAVDKVQVYDKKSDQTVFSGVDDGQRTKTINLALKEEKRHAYFGNEMGGAGTNNRFQAKASINRFDHGNQLSFLGMGNNVNQQGFSFGDYANFTGNTGGGGNNSSGATVNTGLQSGIVTNYAGGLNTNRTSNNGKTKINASYFYNHLDQYITTNIHRINYLPNDSTKSSTYNFDQTTTQNSVTDNHRGNITIDHKIDSANSIKFNTNVAYTISSQPLFSTGKTMNVGNTALQNENTRTTTNNGNNASLTSYLLLRHRFKKKGRTISSNFSFAYADNFSKGTLLSSTVEYRNSGTVTTPANQLNTQTLTSPTYGVVVSYTEPLGGRKYLEFNYNFSNDINHIDREVLNVNDMGQTSLNTQLSNKYRSNYLYNKPGFNFRMNRDNYNFSVGAGLQETHLNGLLILQNFPIDRQFQMIQPSLHFNYDFTEYKRWRLDYTSNMQEPTVSQLQPIINNTDPLNLTVGNPQLSPAYAHNVRSNFSFFDPSRFLNVFALITANYTANAISNSQSVDKNLVRTTKPVNVANSVSWSGNFSLGLPVKQWNSRFHIGPNYSGSANASLLNNMDNTVTQKTLGGTARYNYTLGDVLILDLAANLSQQQTNYSFSPQQNQIYFNKTYTAEANITLLKNYAFNTELNYFIYNSTTTNFHQAIPLWNMSVSRFVLKNNSGEIKIAAINLLNYGVSITQTATSNYLQQQTNNNLGRYLMVSFTYALNKQLNPMNGRDRGRMGGPGMRMR